jgi:hypothetical protein
MKTAEEIRNEVIKLLKELEVCASTDTDKCYAAGAITAAVDAMNRRILA